MEECPDCGKWTFVYDPQRQEYRCYSCGAKQLEAYEIYLQKNNCSKTLIYPNKPVTENQK